MTKIKLSHFKFINYIPYITLTALTLSCNVSTTRQPLQKIEYAMRPSSSPFLQDDLNIQDLINALRAQSEDLVIKNKLMTFGTKQIHSIEYANSLKDIINLWDSTKDREKTLEYITQNFVFLEVYGNENWGEALFTAYFEPVIYGSLKPTEKYYFPLLRVPSDLISLDLEPFDRKYTNETKLRGMLKDNKIVPYYTREDITIKGVLNKQKLEICYVDPIDGFFLHIQGSGVVSTVSNDGTTKDIVLNFAEKNGHKFRGLTNYLINYMPKSKMSFKNIKSFLRKLSKEELYKALSVNPSYVFFKVSDKNAITSSGLPATAGRTIATDKRFFPEGALAYIEVEDPEKSNRKIRRLVLDQDTGGAIVGGGRVDLFWGRGDEAKYVAGRVKNKGKLYYLFPKKYLNRDSQLITLNIDTLYIK